jgi:hypothetical protein
VCDAYRSHQLFGAFYCARAAARAYIKLGIKGAVVFTASMASYRPNKVSHIPSSAVGSGMVANCPISSVCLRLRTARPKLVSET